MFFCVPVVDYSVALVINWSPYLYLLCTVRLKLFTPFCSARLWFSIRVVLQLFHGHQGIKWNTSRTHQFLCIPGPSNCYLFMNCRGSYSLPFFSPSCKLFIMSFGLSFHRCTFHLFIRSCAFFLNHSRNFVLCVCITCVCVIYFYVLCVCACVCVCVPSRDCLCAVQFKA